MTQYRLYYINTASGHINRAEVIDALDDVRAVQACRSRIGLQAMELWCRARRVHSFEAELARSPEPMFA